MHGRSPSTDPVANAAERTVSDAAAGGAFGVPVGSVSAGVLGVGLGIVGQMPGDRAVWKLGA